MTDLWHYSTTRPTILMPYLSAYRCSLIRHVVRSARWMAICWFESLCSLALRSLAMGLPTCARCRTIPLDLFLEQDFVHELYPSITALKSSAEAGCHTCSIFLKSFYSPPGPPVKGHSSGPVLLRRCVESNRGPPLDIKCGSMVGFVSCCVESGLSVGKCSYQERYSPHA